MKVVLRILLFTFLWLNLSQADETCKIIPSKLQKDDLIAIVFPASYVSDKAKERGDIEKAANVLRNLGYRVIFYPKQVEPYGYLAGTDEQRAEAFMAAWKNPEVKAVWCFRGGWGSSRILDLLDYDWIGAHPKILLGMSDNTSLLHAIHQKTGLIVFLGPLLKFFEDAKFDLDRDYAITEFEKITHQVWKGLIEIPTEIQSSTIREGIATGLITGGNLTLIASMCGTNWQLQTDGKILVLEDLEEDIYQIDRHLWQLKNAGLLDHPAAVILSNWTKCRPKVFERSLSLSQVFDEYFHNASYPVIVGFPSGCGKFQTTLPIGIEGRLNTEENTLELLENSVSFD